MAALEPFKSFQIYVETTGEFAQELLIRRLTEPNPRASGRIRNNRSQPGAAAALAIGLGQPIDLVYLVDTSGSAKRAFPGGPTRLDAACLAVAEMNTLLAAGLPGSRTAVVTFQGGPAPAFTTGIGATPRTALANLDVSAINASTSIPLSRKTGQGISDIEIEEFFFNFPLIGATNQGHSTSERPILGARQN